MQDREADEGNIEGPVDGIGLGRWAEKFLARKNPEAFRKVLWPGFQSKNSEFPD